MNRQLIEDFVNGGHQLVDAYRGLTVEQLLAVPIPGSWSLQQIAIHLLESDLIAADRMKRIATMDRPLLIGYDETAFSHLPGVNDLDAQKACELFAIHREMLAVVLRKLPDESFERFGIHNESGKVTLAEMVARYIKHLDGHLVHVARKKLLVS
ncbi:MAG: DinB family protein [Pirellulaceae bacterium]|nr:DinB family protein [Pirellulaceae bacterium]